MSSRETEPGSKTGSEELDWEALRRRSLEPGGFRDDRARLWSGYVYDVSQPERAEVAQDNADASSIHQDERQIGLDTERSFVLYPVGEPKEQRHVLQAQLHELLVSIFRARRKLSYFQGYHDIITVIFLTLPPDMQFLCAEQLSLQRVRDSMGATLEPVLGLLRILKNLLRLADPGYAALLERNSPLPFYALSNLLTLFSHDMPTLALIRHVFDYLLCRPPIIVVYLAASVILSRKDEVERLEKEGEEGMVHSLLSGLPDLFDDEEEPKEYHENVTASANDPSTAPAGPEDSEKPVDPIKDEYDEKDSTPASSPPSSPGLQRTRISLTALLKHADELYAAHPPTHPALAVDTIMGPNSVIFTWSEDPSAMPPADAAEAMVTHPELIVHPFIEEPEDDADEKGRPHHRRRRKLRKARRFHVERRTMLAGAVLVLGVAMAVYGMRARAPGGGADSLGHVRRKDLRRLGRLVGGALVGIGERVLDGFMVW
ncbi:hypothetical protein PLICRDRAFT_111646 [Plicaturopsis crispa FD-325 SS-3]|nr:hypothetical protein PLICRDRAFT_111646 [Plicaturopsis crispa FD-325 SS-3]